MDAEDIAEGRERWQQRYDAARKADRDYTTLSGEEVDRALVERVRQYPGQERQVWEYFQKNPGAKAELRAPILEEKTVDHLLGQINIVEEPISREELFRDEDEDAAEPASEAATVA